MHNDRIRLHTREDLLDFVGKRVTRRSIARALNEGVVEVLGGFQHIPPKGLPGWCLLAESPITKHKFKLAVTVEPSGEHRVWNLEKHGIPWPEWVGGHGAYHGNPLMRGDDPYTYGVLKHVHSSTSSEEEGKEEEDKRELAEGKGRGS